MGSGNAIRGSRVGAGPMGEAERGDAAPAYGSPSTVPTGTRPAQLRDGRRGPRHLGLPRCGFPAGQDSENPRPRRRPSPTRRTWRT
ncbi:RNA polymerase-binding protein RbpA [Actinomadura sp. J1-007]|nr:RNA polymerase-binding protein RbpA [Actinomadura sp. J1-007]